ncbi:MAG: DUF2274 domain-containing protein [Burkholderiaceae bacterium]|nr:DUF2274 domain-containing protein [Burkholderiaceae bacterium]
MSIRLRLGPLPKLDTVKLTLTIPATLKDDLDRYAALHGQSWGYPIDAIALIPHMLQTFMSRDRGFRQAAKEVSAPKQFVGSSQENVQQPPTADHRDE